MLKANNKTQIFVAGIALLLLSYSNQALLEEAIGNLYLDRPQDELITIDARTEVDVDSIVRTHGYRYEEGMHIFGIQFV